MRIAPLTPNVPPSALPAKSGERWTRKPSHRTIISRTIPETTAGSLSRMAQASTLTSASAFA